DSGSAANWYARQLKVRPGMRGSLSGTLATMGPGVPYAIGAKFGHPQRPMIALVGDGAMQMNGMAELITIRRYWEEWEDPRLIVCVLHNNDLNQVTWEIRATEGAPTFLESQRLPEVSYAGFADSIGLRGITVERPEEIGGAWDEALSADRPVVLDVYVDPDMPPIPPHATLEQARDTAAAVARGDVSACSIVAQGLTTKAQQFLPQPDKDSGCRRSSRWRPRSTPFPPTPPRPTAPWPGRRPPWCWSRSRRAVAPGPASRMGRRPARPWCGTRSPTS